LKKPTLEPYGLDGCKVFCALLDLLRAGELGNWNYSEEHTRTTEPFWWVAFAHAPVLQSASFVHFLLQIGSFVRMTGAMVFGQVSLTVLTPPASAAPASVLR